MHGLNKKRFPLFTTHQFLLFTTNVMCVNGLGLTLHVNVSVCVIYIYIYIYIVLCSRIKKYKYLYDFTLLCETM